MLVLRCPETRGACQVLHIRLLSLGQLNLDAKQVFQLLLMLSLDALSHALYVHLYLLQLYHLAPVESHLVRGGGFIC